MLGIGDILHRLLYHRATVVVVYQSLAIEPILLQPTEFLTMRTVGPDTLPVASDGTVDNLISTVKHRIRTFKIANLRSRIIDEARLDILYHWLAIRILITLHHGTFNLDIAITIIGEMRMPSLDALAVSRLLSLSAERISKIVRTARLFLVAGSLCGQGLGGIEPYLLSYLSTDLDLWETCEILSHIQHEGSCRNRMFGIGSLGDLLRSELMTALHTEVFHHLHRLCHLLAQNATRSLLYRHWFPGRRDAGILVFTTIDTVEGDAARRIFP